MAKKNYVWLLKRIASDKYDIMSQLPYHTISTYYSSLKKVRVVIKHVIETGLLSSINNYTAEEWQYGTCHKAYGCVVNSGGTVIATITQILVN